MTAKTLLDKDEALAMLKKTIAKAGGGKLTERERAILAASSTLICTLAARTEKALRALFHEIKKGAIR